MSSNSDNQAARTPSKTIHITNIPLEFDRAQLRTIFCKYGKIKSLFHYNKDPKGQPYAFCEYEDQRAANNALTINGNPPHSFKVKYGEFWKKRKEEKLGSEKSKLSSTQSQFSRQNEIKKLSDNVKKYNNSINDSNKKSRDSILVIFTEIVEGFENYLCCEYIKKNVNLDSLLSDISKNKMTLNFDKRWCLICQKHYYFIKPWDFLIMDKKCFCDYEKKILDLERKSLMEANSHNLNKYFKLDLCSLHSISKTEELHLKPVKSVSQNDWVCLISSDSIADIFRRLCNDFIEYCDSVDKNNVEITNESLAAVKIVDNDEWYRAILLPDKSWALIDDGNIIPSACVSVAIPCPAEYVKYPAFSCVLSFSNPVKDLQNDDGCSFVLKAGNDVLIKLKNGTLASATLWDPIEQFNKNIDKKNCTNQGHAE